VQTSIWSCAPSSMKQETVGTVMPSRSVVRCASETTSSMTEKNSML
jgi:hypothetical protein